MKTYKIRPEFHKMQNELLNEFPCIFLKSGSIEGKPGISEIILNEDFMKEAGYPLEMFASQVLEEGIPQFMPYENEAQNLILKTMLERYFELGSCDYKSPEISTHLFTKDNYVIRLNFYK